MKNLPSRRVPPSRKNGNRRQRVLRLKHNSQVPQQRLQNNRNRPAHHQEKGGRSNHTKKIRKKLPVPQSPPLKVHHRKRHLAPSTTLRLRSRIQSLTRLTRESHVETGNLTKREQDQMLRKRHPRRRKYYKHLQRRIIINRVLLQH